MSIRRQVMEFVRNHPGVRFCDCCIATELKAPSESGINSEARYVSSVPRVLTLGFARSSGNCSGCGAKRLIRCKALILGAVRRDAGFWQR